MTNKIYDTAIFGAGFFAYSYAEKHPNTIIIERAECSDQKFCGCMNLGENWNISPKGKFSKELIEIFNKYNLINGDKADVLSFESVVCEFIKPKGFQMLFLSDVISVFKQKEIYNVILYTNAGNVEIKAKKIIDTTPKGVMLNKGDYLKVLNILSLNNCGDFDQIIKKTFGKNAKTFIGTKPNQKIASIPCGKEETQIDARIRIADKWKETLSLKKVKIAFVASEFQYKLKEQIKFFDQNYIKISECNYKNAIEICDLAELEY